MHGKRKQPRNVAPCLNIFLEPSAIDPALSEKRLLMGTVLPLANDQEGAITARLSWNNYVVLMPVRNADGSFAQKRALIPAIKIPVPALEQDSLPQVKRIAMWWLFAQTLPAPLRWMPLQRSSRRDFFRQA